MEPLRLVANSYKHDPSMQPDKELLKLLELETKCAPLPESELFREALAAFVDLETSAAYCDIAERFGDLASGFLKDVRNRTKVNPVKWGPIKWTDIAL